MKLWIFILLFASGNLFGEEWISTNSIESSCSTSHLDKNLHGLHYISDLQCTDLANEDFDFDSDLLKSEDRQSQIQPKIIYIAGTSSSIIIKTILFPTLLDLPPPCIA